MYQVLYRKWRPQTFSDVAGQEHITTTLRNELISGRISHAYLFTGSRGTGKTTCAKILAKAVNCLNPIDGNPCNECENCRGIDNGTITDVSEIDAASNNGVDNIRDLRDETAFSPAQAKYRVFIIDEVHMLSQGAFNALLKTLEEPPSHVVFILATTEVHKIPATILSRCQRFDFRRIPPEDIAKRLEYVTDKENATITHEAAMLIARIADGALRDALSLLDQCIIKSGESRVVDEQVVGDTAGLASKEYIYSMITAIREKNISLILSNLDEIHNASKDMSRFCEELIDYFRAMMIIRTVKQPEGLLKLPVDQIDKLKVLSDRFNLNEIMHIMQCLQRTLDDMSYSSNKRVDMELSLMKAASPELDSSPEALSRRLSIVESAIKSGNITNIAKNSDIINNTNLEKSTLDENSDTDLSKMDKNPVMSQEDALSQDKVKPEHENDKIIPLDCWPEVLKELMTTAMPLHGVLGGSCAYISGNRVLIDAPNELFRQLIVRESHKNALKTAIFNQTGKRYAIGPYKNKTRDNTNEEDKLTQFADSLIKNGVDVTFD